MGGGSKKWTIINYDILKNFHSLPTKNKSVSKREESNYIKNTNFDLVIIDEAHAIKNTPQKEPNLLWILLKI